jgi:hypothetical protein
MTRPIIVSWILAFSLGCLPAAPEPKTPARETETQSRLHIQQEPQTLTIFLTGNTLSTIKPCGCAEGQLGGFDRRQAVLNTVKPENRLIIDTGNLLAEDTEQDRIKFDIIVQAFSMLRYDLVALNDTDFTIAQELGLLENLPFNVINLSPQNDPSMPRIYQRQLQLEDRTLDINVAAIDLLSEPIELIEDLFPDENENQNLNILIIDDCDSYVIENLIEYEMLDVVVCPTAADEPEIIDSQTDKPLLITVGRLGKYCGKLSVRLTQDSTITLDYTKLQVNEQLPQNLELVNLYKDYQLIVKDANLLEQVPKVPLPNNLEYLGSQSCNMAPCHQYQYKIWSEKPHAQAYKTLIEVGSQYDPECIVCHVVGLKYETGFVNENSQYDLRDVGCELCHGPGSKHMVAITMDEPDNKTSEPKAQCIDCHTPEHSPAYQEQEDEYREKIRHWEEQKDPNTVQN